MHSKFQIWNDVNSGLLRDAIAAGTSATKKVHQKTENTGYSDNSRALHSTYFTYGCPWCT